MGLYVHTVYPPAREPGDHRISGIVDELGVPGAYLVRLYNRASGLLVREVISSDSGEYDFEYIANRPAGYFTVAHDWPSPNPVNAAISDLITPEPMA